MCFPDQQKIMASPFKVLLMHTLLTLPSVCIQIALLRTLLRAPEELSTIPLLILEFILCCTDVRLDCVQFRD